MRIKLSEHFTYRKLLRYVLPSIVMMIFTSIYGVVDGIFVSNYVGKTAFAAINLIMPVLMGFGVLGFMFGTGGSALVAKVMGEGKKQKANEYFSMIVYVTIIGGIVLTVLGQIFLRPITVWMGATDNLIEDCILYGRIMLTFQTAYMLQNVFQSFFPAAEKPKLGLGMTVAAGVTNIVLDALFVAALGWGIAGAATATVISQMVGGIVPVFYFAKKNSSLLHLTGAKFERKVILRVCVNGSSEFMTNLSLSLVNILYNFQLMKFAGEDGIAAYGVIMYVNFIFLGLYIGYSMGSAPIVGYHYGADNRSELKSLFRKSLVLMTIFGVCLTAIAEVLVAPLSHLFVGYDQSLYEMTKHGFSLYAISFLIIGFNIFSSGFFTALNDGAVSAAISFLRTLLFQLVVVLGLPMVIGLDGIWLAITVAEVLALAVTVAFFVRKRNVYHYM